MKSSPNVGKIDPPEIIEISDSATGLLGWLVVDSTVNNHCYGGLRMAPDVTPAELTVLARAMTLKFGFLGLPHGGAKAGIVCDEDATREEKLGLLTAFGMKIRDLLACRVYSPGPDMGTDNEYIRHMLKSSGARVPARSLTGERSGWYTSLTVVASAKVVAAKMGIDLSKATAAIEGFGKVGRSVARGLHALGCKILAVSTSRGALYSPRGLDVSRLLELSNRFGSRVIEKYEGAERIPKEELLELEADVLLPCAKYLCITMMNVSRIKAKLISPGANMPLSEEAEDLLFRRGVISAPSFIANSGGTLGGTMEFAGFGTSAISEFIDRNFTRQIIDILETSLNDDVCPRVTAERMVLDRGARIKAASERPSLSSGVFGFFLDLYRNGLIPKAAVRALSGQYFCKRIGGRI